MGKITLTLVIILAFNLYLICSMGTEIEQKKFALILPANFSKYRHELTNEMQIKSKIFTWEKIHYEKDCNYCVHFEVLKNIECLLNNLTKKEVYVLCEKPAIDQFGTCNGDGFYGLNTYFLNLQTNCFGEWKKLNKTSSCNSDFIFV
jgi:hypothetical protein